MFSITQLSCPLVCTCRRLLLASACLPFRVISLISESCQSSQVIRQYKPRCPCMQEKEFLKMKLFCRTETNAKAAISLHLQASAPLTSSLIYGGFGRHVGRGALIHFTFLCSATFLRHTAPARVSVTKASIELRADSSRNLQKF